MGRVGQIFSSLSLESICEEYLSVQIDGDCDYYVAEITEQYSANYSAK